MWLSVVKARSLNFDLAGVLLDPMASNSLKLRAVAFISPQVAPRLSDPTSF